MRSIISLLSVVLILSIVALVAADAGSCVCNCQVGQTGNNGTMSGEIRELGDQDVDDCKTCNSAFCSKTYPGECVGGSLYAQCDHAGSTASSVAVSAVVMFFAAFLYMM